MTVTLYHTSDNPLTVRKTLTNASSDNTAVIRGPLDSLNPIVTVQRTISLSTYNYIEISGRFFFIRDVTVDRTGLSVLQLHIDVLYTHSAGLMQCRCAVNRADTLNDSGIFDGMQRFRAAQDLDCYTVNGLGLCYPERVIMICNT